MQTGIHGCMRCITTTTALSPLLHWPPPGLWWLHTCIGAQIEAWKPPWPVAKTKQHPLGYTLMHSQHKCSSTTAGLPPLLTWPPPSLWWLHTCVEAYLGAWEPPWPLQRHDTSPLATDLCIFSTSVAGSGLACHLFSNDSSPMTLLM